MLTFIIICAVLAVIGGWGCNVCKHNLSRKD